MKMFLAFILAAATSFAVTFAFVSSSKKTEIETERPPPPQACSRPYCNVG